MEHKLSTQLETLFGTKEKQVRPGLATVPRPAQGCLLQEAEAREAFNEQPEHLNTQFINQRIIMRSYTDATYGSESPNLIR